MSLATCYCPNDSLKSILKIRQFRNPESILNHAVWLATLKNDLFRRWTTFSSTRKVCEFMSRLIHVTRIFREWKKPKISKYWRKLVSTMKFAFEMAISPYKAIKNLSDRLHLERTYGEPYMSWHATCPKRIYENFRQNGMSASESDRESF